MSTWLSSEGVGKDTFCHFMLVRCTENETTTTLLHCLQYVIQHPHFFLRDLRRTGNFLICSVRLETFIEYRLVRQHNRLMVHHVVEAKILCTSALKMNMTHDTEYKSRSIFCSLKDQPAATSSSSRKTLDGAILWKLKPSARQNIKMIEYSWLEIDLTEHSICPTFRLDPLSAER